ncbi:MAG: hypothetical protein EP348_08165 [Alphaproteobacteria bacterium]|nr:MAG: hypothetical protein EP348_08165 [Alphaproteobacteria bacterium]
MVVNLTRALAMSALLLVASCSFVDEKLLPPLTGEQAKTESAAKAENAEKQAMAGAQQATPVNEPAAKPTAMMMSRFALPDVTDAASTGTVVGKKVEELRDQLRSLQSKINQHSAAFEKLEASTTETSQRYHGTVAAISTRLQIGTTKGNPILVNQWNEAQKDLEQVAGDVSSMNSLATAVASDTDETSYLLDQIRSAFDLSGAIEEDHRQLTVLEDEASRTSVLVNRMMSQLSGDINRQTAYVGAERTNLTNLSNAIQAGHFLNTEAAESTMTSTAKTASNGNADDGRQALVIIRFDRDNVAYEQPLYDAVSRALQERPQANFDVVSIAPLSNNATTMTANQQKSVRNAERVLKSLTDMGLPPSRVSLASTSNASVSSSEVHIYIR